MGSILLKAVSMQRKTAEKIRADVSLRPTLMKTQEG